MHDADHGANGGAWTSTSLGDATSCTLGGTPSTDVPQFWGGSIPWMASGDVHLRRIQDVPGRITSAGLAASNATLVRPPAVAVGLAGQGKTRGTVALMLCEVSTNQSIALLRGNEGRLQTEYLFHNLDRRYEELRARSSGGGRGGLSKGILDALQIELPPLHEQSVITEVLDTLDATIRQTEAIIEKLKQVKLGLLHDLLTRGIDANGELRPPQSQAPHLYKESPLGWIPTEWHSGPLEEFLGRIIDYRGKTPEKTETGVTLITARNVRLGYLDPEPREFIRPGAFDTWMTRGLPSQGDILFTMEAPLGNVAQIETDERLAFAQRLVILQVGHEVHATFLKYLLLGETFRQKLFALGSGSTVEGIQQSALRRIPIAVPVGLNEQRLIAERLAGLDGRVDLEIRTFDKAKALKSGLMDDLLTGRVRVTALLHQGAPA